MNDYMKSLHDKFCPSCDARKSEIDGLHKQLVSELSKEHRRKLLEIIDLGLAQSDDASLHGFVAGFRLASGIAHELGQEEPYSFARDEEQKAEKVYREEHGL